MRDRKLVLVKHSAPVVERDVAPKRWRLSENGRRRCVLLAEKLGPYNPDFVVSSEEPKAAETARLVAEHLGVGSSVRPGLHEHDRTGAPFLGDDEFYRTVKRFFRNPGELVWGNETADQAVERFEVAVRRVLEERGEEALAIVAHGTVISLFVARHNGIDAYALWRDLGLPSFCVLSPGFRQERIIRRVI